MSNTLTPRQIEAGNKNDIKVGSDVIILGYPTRHQG